MTRRVKKKKNAQLHQVCEEAATSNKGICDKAREDLVMRTREEEGSKQ